MVSIRKKSANRHIVKFESVFHKKLAYKEIKSSVSIIEYNGWQAKDQNSEGCFSAKSPGKNPGSP